MEVLPTPLSRSILSGERPIKPNPSGPHVPLAVEGAVFAQVIAAIQNAPSTAGGM